MESIFNKDFYPTPEAVVYQMINGEDLNGKTILEPSAGSGNIVKVLQDNGAKVIACEKNPDLAKIVSSKCKLIGNDFLSVKAEEISHIHAIYMNPPFSADERHILHAWEIAPSGCHIVALCNFNTICNDYSSSRRRLTTLIKNYGSSANIGDVFSDAERTTGVEIGLINLYKPKTDNDFGDYFDSEEDDFESQENGIMSYNAVREVVNRYVSAVKLYDQVIENAIQMNSLVGVFGIDKLTFTCKQEQAEVTKEDFAKELQKKGWLWIFSKMNMDKFMTASLKSDINKFVEDQQKVPFTMKNIYKMFQLVIGTHGHRMEKVIIEVFEKLTQHYSENRFMVEGWKTNSHYLVNQKFILNDVFSTDKYYTDRPHVVWDGRNANLLDDLCKALSYITGIKCQDGALYQFFDKDKDHGKYYDWNFFEIKGFKKGTAHCRFKYENVWAMFNQAVAKCKGFELPESLNKKAA